MVYISHKTKTFKKVIQKGEKSRDGHRFNRQMEEKKQQKSRVCNPDTRIQPK